jgi:large subunit ribosomal protein L17e
MLITKAEEYLKDVLEHKRCIPYSRFDHSVGRCSAAIQFGLTKGRYPEKSVRLILNLLQNAKSNAETKKLSIEKLIIKNVFVNVAAEGRRRTYRAHGSINAYCSSNCHVEIICEELKERVKKEKKEGEKNEGHFINQMMHVRRGLAKRLKDKKYVSVGGKKDEKK